LLNFNLSPNVKKMEGVCTGYSILLTNNAPFNKLYCLYSDFSDL